MKTERNLDGTIGPEHVTDEGRELVTPVEERIDHAEAKRIAEEWTTPGWLDVSRPLTKRQLALARAYLALLTEHFAREQGLIRVIGALRSALLSGEPYSRRLEKEVEDALTALPATEPAQPEEEPHG